MRLITPEILAKYLPPQQNETPIAAAGRTDDGSSTERELLYKILFDMRADINELKRMLGDLMRNASGYRPAAADVKALLPSAAQSAAYPPAVYDARTAAHGYGTHPGYAPSAAPLYTPPPASPVYAESEEVVEEAPRERTKADMQREQIVRALRRNNGRRREAAAELFMSERTLYRKLKELGIEESY